MALTVDHRNFNANHRFHVNHRLIMSVLLASCLFIAAPAPAQESTKGEWQAKSQLVWDQDARKLVRKNFRVWDPHPELGLEFSWEQQSGPAADPDGAVNGSGR